MRERDVDVLVALLLGVAIGVLLMLCVNAGTASGAAGGCQSPLRAYAKQLKPAFHKKRWRDATPARAGEQHRLERLRACAAPPARKKMRRMHRKARARFAANFRRMIDPPGRAFLDALGGCEADSSGGYRADTGNGFYGRYQFDPPTWRSVGGSGYPHLAPPREQDYRAAKLYRRRGNQPWPNCP